VRLVLIARFLRLALARATSNRKEREKERERGGIIISNSDKDTEQFWEDEIFLPYELSWCTM